MSKVIETERYVNVCECGDINTMLHYSGFKEGTSQVIHDIFLAFCRCGNVFVATMEELPEPKS